MNHSCHAFAGTKFKIIRVVLYSLPT